MFLGGFFFLNLLKALMYSHLSSSVDCLSNHLSLNLNVEWPTHLHFLSHLGGFKNPSLYTHMKQWGLQHIVKIHNSSDPFMCI